MTDQRKQIERAGFRVMGTRHGGWVVVDSGQQFDWGERGRTYSESPFIAAFSNWGDLLAWFETASRDDPDSSKAA